MPRKKTTGAAPQPRANGLIGFVLIVLALMLFTALVTFNPADVSFTTVPPNDHMHNWIGPFGAHIANFLFLVFGLAAYVLVSLPLLYGMGYFVESFRHLREKWPWLIAFVIACVGGFDLYNALFDNHQEFLNITSAGGMVGDALNSFFIQRLFGQIGGTIIYAATYSVSLIYLLNIDLVLVAKIGLQRWRDARAARMSEEEKLAEKVVLLEKEAEALEKELGAAPKAKKSRKRKSKLSDFAEEPVIDVEANPASNADIESVDEPSADPEPEINILGADMQPVPEPTIRGLDDDPPIRPRPKPDDIPDKDESEFELPPEDAVEAGTIISADEIVSAATTQDVLGADASKPDEDAAASDEDSEQTAEEVKIAGSGVEGDSTLEDATTDEPDTTSEEGNGEEEPAVAEAAEEPAEDQPKPKPKPKLQSRKAKPKSTAVAGVPKIGNYKKPGTEFLNDLDEDNRPTESKDALMANARLMQTTLRQFGIEVSLGDITRGPTITRYELHPAPGIKLEKIANLSNNITAALKAERINILAPVPGKSSVGIEVPNKVKTMVIMRDILESPEWRKTKARIPLALGKDVYGKPMIADLAEMPHLLIAGSTGSGKSVCINSIIASLLTRFAPDEMRFVMIDPKVVELQQYNVLPHLVVPVVTDPKKVVMALRWVINEMEKRYQIFAKEGVRNIHSFNTRGASKRKKKQEQIEMQLKAAAESGEEGFAVELDDEIVGPDDDDINIPDRLSYITVVIDELADLMLVAPADVEMAIARITQMARAAGIHCIVATQRPSVDVITGVIKANIPSRIAFQVAAKVDSRTILDAMGADKLLGKGDMLYLPPGSGTLIRAQGAFITDEEIQDMVDYIAEQGQPAYETEIHEQLSKPASAMGGESNGGASDEDAELIEKCIEVIRVEQKASVSMMQRRLRLGYTRAARIMDHLEDMGIVGPSKGAEPREILVDLEED